MTWTGPGIAVLAAGAAFVAALIIWQHVVCREQRRRDKDARKRIAAREAVKDAWPGLPKDGRPLDRYEAEKLMDAIDALRGSEKETAR